MNQAGVPQGIRWYVSRFSTLTVTIPWQQYSSSARADTGISGLGL